jgi:putative ABC transport system permease protein
MSVAGSAKVRRDRVVIDLTISGATADALTGVVDQGKVQPVDWPEGTLLEPSSFIAQGRIFTPIEVLSKANVCVLGHQTAEDLFQGDYPLGETVLVNRQRFLVIGVLAELEPTDPEERNNSKINEGLYMPISTAIQNLYDSEPSVSITAKAMDESNIDETKEAIVNFLRERHNITMNSEGEYEDDFYIMTRQEIIGAQQEAARTLSTLLVALAVVSLVVGGIGIMNVMLVSVSERTREIGICMAIGARQRDIVAQFLIEAIMLSAASGIAGIVLGISIVPLAANFNQGMALLDPASIPLSFTVAVLTGAIFGLYPALRASKLLPVEALRYE